MPFEQLIEPPAGPAARGAAKWLLARTVCFVAATVALLGAVVVLDAPRQANEYLAYPVTVSLGATENVAGLQFDIILDPELVRLVDIEAGPAAISAGKDVVFSMLDESTVRVLVVGLNQDQLGGGVVANLYATPLQESGAAPLLQVGGMVVSDPVGNPAAPGEEPEAEEDSESNESLESSDSDVRATEAASARDAESGAKDQSTASSGPLMPAILDALLGDYAGPTATETAGAGDLAEPAGSGVGGGESGGAAGQAQTIGRDGYAIPGVLPPQVYTKGAAARPAGARQGNPALRSGGSPAVPAENLPGALDDRDAAALGEPMRVSWAPAMKAVTLDESPTAASIDEKVNFSAYVNRRALLPAAACIAALLLVLRNSFAPLIRLLKDLVRP